MAALHIGHHRRKITGIGQFMVQHPFNIQRQLPANGFITVVQAVVATKFEFVTFALDQSGADHINQVIVKTEFTLQIDRVFNLHFGHIG